VRASDSKTKTVEARASAARADGHSPNDAAASSSCNGDGYRPPAAKGSQVAAFFDVDGTLLSCQSGTLYIGFLRRQNLMTRADQARIYWGYLTYRLGVLNMRRLAATLSRWLDGREEREVIDHCRLWYGTEVKNYFREFVLEKVEEHRRAGHVVALLTGGTHYLNDLIAADLGLDHVLASRLEVVDGKFTGKPSGTLCYGAGKISHAEEFAAAQSIDLEASYFYTDSITDLPMLQRVGHPIAVCPDPRLRREARGRGWTILDAPVTPTERRTADASA